MIFDETIDGISLEDVIEAYFDCRNNKRNTVNQLEFEKDYERNCIQLWREINERRYEPCTIVTVLASLRWQAAEPSAHCEKIAQRVH